MTRFKVTLRPYPGQLTGNPDSAYSVYRLNGWLIGVVSRKGKRWMAWNIGGESRTRWFEAESRAEAIHKLGGQT